MVSLSFAEEKKKKKKKKSKRKKSKKHSEDSDLESDSDGDNRYCFISKQDIISQPCVCLYFRRSKEKEEEKEEQKVKAYSTTEKKIQLNRIFSVTNQVTFTGRRGLGKRKQRKIVKSQVVPAVKSQRKKMMILLGSCGWRKLAWMKM